MASIALVVLLVASVVFFAFRLLPGDPVDLILGERAPIEDRLRLRQSLGLDRSLGAQYVAFLVALVHGDLGRSMQHPEHTATQVVLGALPATTALAALSVLLAALAGTLLAITSVARQGRPLARLCDALIGGGSTVPLLAYAPAVTWVFAVRVRWVPLPADPDAGLVGLLWASLLLSMPLGAAVARVSRAALRTVSHATFLMVARAKGRSEWAVWLFHALPPCSGPIVTVISAQLGALLGGAILLERLLERPGLGTVLSEALAARDLPVLQATVVASCLLFVVVQELGRTLHVWLDPRAA